MILPQRTGEEPQMEKMVARAALRRLRVGSLVRLDVPLNLCSSVVPMFFDFKTTETLPDRPETFL